MAKTKVCFKCGHRKSMTEFYKHSAMADGRLGKCAECTRKDVRSNRLKKLDYYRAYDRKRGSRITKEAQRKYRKKKPMANYARAMVARAVKTGKLFKPQQCDSCGNGTRIHAHHDDYSRPLIVRWLCPACHARWHRKNGEALNAY